MATELKLEGAQADYSLQTVPTPEGDQAVLIGSSAATQGDVHELTGIQTLLFSDGKVDLFLSSLAQSHSQLQTPNQPNTSVTQRLVQWIESGDELIEGEPQEQTSTANTLQSNPSAPHLSAAPLNLKSDFDALPKTQADSAFAPINRQINTEASPQSPNNTATPDGAKVNASEPTHNNNNNTDTNPQQSPDQAAQNETTHTNNSTQLTPLLSPVSATQPDSTSASPEQISRFFELNKSNDQTSNLPAPPLINQVTGTSGPDTLVGGAGPNTIDGQVNFDLENGAFYEQLIGGPSNDVIYYRGFWGDVPGEQTPVLALLTGGGGNDHLHVALDKTTTVGIDGGSGTNKLILTPESGQSSPWDPSYVEWNWVQGETSALLSAQYSQPNIPSAGLLELNASIQQIAAGAGTTLNLVRPNTPEDTQMVGTHMNDWLLAAQNTTHIQAGNGNDFVLAKAGNTIELGQGINTLYSDSNNITLSYEDSPYGVRVNLQNKTGLVFDDDMGLYSLDRLMTTPNKVIGSAHNDVIVGNKEDNTFTIGGGIDQVWGGGGQNTYIIQSNPLTDRVYINDFDFSTDQLMFDLQSFDVALDRKHKGIEIRDTADSLIFHSGSSTAEEENALLKLMINHETGWIQWKNVEKHNDFIFIGQHNDSELGDNLNTNHIDII